MADVALPDVEEDQITTRMEGDNLLLLVKGATNPHKLCGAILNLVRGKSPHQIVVRAIGAGAVNQAVKGCAIARNLARTEEGIDITYGLDFASIRIHGEDRSAMTFVVNARPNG